MIPSPRPRLHILPSDLGLDPTRWLSWRPEQERMILTTLDLADEYRVICHSMPTGTGKSLAYIGYALMTGQRAIVLTGTKALQGQLIRDFGDQAAEVRGKGSYECPIYGDCESGASMRCKYHQSPNCPRIAATMEARNSNLVVANYAYWCVKDREQELGKFDLLVLDEAHNAADWVIQSMETVIGWHDLAVTQTKPADIDSIPKALDWCRTIQPELNRLLDRAKEAARQGVQDAAQRVRGLNMLLQKIQTLGKSATAETWMRERRDDGVVFTPLWAAPYVEERLFREVKTVLALSATLTPYNVTTLLGLERSEVSYQEYPSPFPPEQSPVYWVPTASVKKDMDYRERKSWLNRIDQIVRPWTSGAGNLGPYKGVIHAHSYPNTKAIGTECDTSPLMIYPERGGKDAGQVITNQDAIKRYVSAPAPAVLVSPAAVEGYDFGGDLCRFQILAKMPFADLGSKIIEARSKADPRYSANLTIQALVQMTGRGNRFIGDWCINILIDDNIRWFLAKWKTEFPQYWLNLYRKSMTIPVPQSVRNLTDPRPVQGGLFNAPLPGPMITEQFTPWDDDVPF